MFDFKLSTFSTVSTSYFLLKRYKFFAIYRNQILSYHAIGNHSWRRKLGTMGFSLTNYFSQNITQVPNIFIDTYMPQANGSFVKVYLFLLRQAGTAASTLSVEDLADMLSNTEADIIRALRYWEKQGILSITEAGGQIIEISLLPLTDEKTAATVPATETAATITPAAPAAEETARIAAVIPATETAAAITPAAPAAETALPASHASEPEIPKRHAYSPLQAEALKKDREIESCLSMVEALLGTTLGDAHMQLVLYLMSDLGFSLSLVVTLYETALSRGKRNPRYMEAIALDWAKKGIRTTEEAENEVSAFNGTYRIISNALGIKRALAPAEKAVIDKWEMYHFPDAVLEEACSRTVLQSGDTNLNYTAKILADWHKKGVTSLKDIEDCDKSFFRQKNAMPAKNNVIRRSKNKFQQFPQREYSQEEYADLEKQLLHQ